MISTERSCRYEVKYLSIPTAVGSKLRGRDTDEIKRSWDDWRKSREMGEVDMVPRVAWLWNGDMVMKALF